MAITLPGDIFIPQRAREIVGYDLFNNFDVLGKMAARDGSRPIKLSMGKDLLPGNIIDAPIISKIGGLVARQDLTSSGNATASKFTTRDEKGVRCTLKVGPVKFSDIVKGMSGVSKESFTAEFARQSAEDAKLYIRNAILAALRGAITNMTSALHTKSVWVTSGTKANLNTPLLAQGRSLMGDALNQFQSDGAGIITRSEAYYDLLAAQLGSVVAGIADRSYITGNPHTLGLDTALADDTALLTADAGFDKYYTMLIGSSAIEVEISNVEYYEPFLDVNAENPNWCVRGTIEFTLRIPGFTWDTANGGINPDATAIALSTNWDPLYDDHRQVKAVLIEHNSSLGN